MQYILPVTYHNGILRLQLYLAIQSRINANNAVTIAAIILHRAVFCLNYVIAEKDLSITYHVLKSCNQCVVHNIIYDCITLTYHQLGLIGNDVVICRFSCTWNVMCILTDAQK